MPDESSVPETNVVSPFSQLMWSLRLSAMYHLKRERFLDGADRMAKAISALGSAAAFSQLKTEPVIGLWITGVISLIATISLVYAPSTKARRHSELARDYKRLEAEVVMAGDEISNEQLAKLQGKYLNLEASEPAALGALVTQCHNELSAASGNYSAVTPLGFWERTFKNWFDFDQSINHEKL